MQRLVGAGSTILLQEHLDHLILPNLEMFGNWTAPGPSLSLNRTVKDHVRSLFQRSGISTARYEAGALVIILRTSARFWAAWGRRALHGLVRVLVIRTGEAKLAINARSGTAHTTRLSESKQANRTFNFLISNLCNVANKKDIVGTPSQTAPFREFLPV